MADNNFNNLCKDFLGFQELLKKMRKIDDNIVYALNTTIPTDSFRGDRSHPSNQCKDLWNQLNESYQRRENAIRKCIEDFSEELKQLKKQKEKDENNLTINKDLKKARTRVRLMQNELSVEEVIKDRSTKIFYERCRTFYKPPVTTTTI